MTPNNTPTHQTPLPLNHTTTTNKNMHSNEQNDTYTFAATTTTEKRQLKKSHEKFQSKNEPSALIEDHQQNTVYLIYWDD